ncbi:MAG: hypothetical protein NTW45_02160 [Rhodocyclales bacterium]|nr:hypothetical protein [Rhodocyclales bacterium]
MRTDWRAFSKLYGAVLLLGYCIASSAAGDPAVAMVTDLEGKAVVLDDFRKPAVSILSEIRQDARVQVDAGARLVAVYLSSGQTYEMKGPSVVLFRLQQPESLSGDKPQARGNALSKGGKDIRIKPVVVAQAALVMRSVKPSLKLKLLNPLGNKTLEERPVFAWKGLAPDLQYRFRLLDETGKSLYEVTVEDTSLQLPQQVQLKEAATYTWVVSTQHPDGSVFSNASDFSLVSADLRRQVESLRPADNSPFSERVAFAAWLEEMALRDEARKYWKAAAAERQDDPRLKVMAGE